MTNPSGVTGKDEAAWRTYATMPLSPVLEAALACFVEQGYHGSPIRTIAARSGLSVPGLYHHYPSKQALLVAIVTHAMDELWWRSKAAVYEAGDDLMKSLDLQVECLVLFHAHRREFAFIAASEIRSLVGPAREAHIAARDRQQRMMDDVVERGIALGLFATQFPREVSRAVVTMCTGVAQWYRPDGGLRPDELASEYCAIARMTVGSEVTGSGA